MLGQLLDDDLGPRDLLTTWENWHARNTTRNTTRIAPCKAKTDEQRETLSQTLDASPEVDPLDALRDTTEVVALLLQWHRRIVADARSQGVSWEQIGSAMGVPAHPARFEADAFAEKLYDERPH